MDVVDLALYIAEDNPEIGAAVFDDVWDTCALLTRMPNMGAPIDTLLDETEIRYEIREIMHALPLLQAIRRFPLTVVILVSSMTNPAVEITPPPEDRNRRDTLLQENRPFFVPVQE